MLKHQVAEKTGISSDELSNIKNIIFDLGGVIIDIYYTKTIDNFKELGFIDFEPIFLIFWKQEKFLHMYFGWNYANLIKN